MRWAKGAERPVVQIKNAGRKATQRSLVVAFVGTRSVDKKGVVRHLSPGKQVRMPKRGGVGDVTYRVQLSGSLVRA